jgi:hypothetical protein
MKSPSKIKNKDVLVLKSFPWKRQELLSDDRPLLEYKGQLYISFTNQTPREQTKLYNAVRCDIKKSKKNKKEIEEYLIRFSN